MAECQRRRALPACRVPIRLPPSEPTRGAAESTRDVLSDAGLLQAPASSTSPSQPDHLALREMLLSLFVFSPAGLARGSHCVCVCADVLAAMNSVVLMLYQASCARREHPWRLQVGLTCQHMRPHRVKQAPKQENASSLRQLYGKHTSAPPGTMWCFKVHSSSRLSTPQDCARAYVMLLHSPLEGPKGDHTAKRDQARPSTGDCLRRLAPQHGSAGGCGSGEGAQEVAARVSPSGEGARRPSLCISHPMANAKRRLALFAAASCRRSGGHFGRALSGRATASRCYRSPARSGDICHNGCRRHLATAATQRLLPQRPGGCA